MFDDKNRSPVHSLWLSGLADVWGSVKRRVSGQGEVVGLWLMVGSAAAFSLMAAIAKYMLPETPTQAVVLSRGTLMVIVFLILARRKQVDLIGKRPGTLALRGILGYAAVSCYFYSVQHLPIGDAILIQYSHPALVAAVAPFLLREKTGRFHWPCVVAATLGVALIVGPSGHLRADALIGLCGAACSGAAYMAVRNLSATEHPLTILVWFPALTIPGALIGTLAAGEASLPRSFYEVAGHLLVFLCAMTGQLTLTMGLARAGAARATAVTMTGPIFGWIFGLWLFGSVPSWSSAIGTTLVISALSILALNRP